MFSPDDREFLGTVFPRVEAAATINLTCSSTAATIRGRLQFEGGYYIPCV